MLKIISKVNLNERTLSKPNIRRHSNSTLNYKGNRDKSSKKNSKDKNNWWLIMKSELFRLKLNERHFYWSKKKSTIERKILSPRLFKLRNCQSNKNEKNSMKRLKRSVFQHDSITSIKLKIRRLNCMRRIMRLRQKLRGFMKSWEKES